MKLLHLGYLLVALYIVAGLVFLTGRHPLVAVLPFAGAVVQFASIRANWDLLNDEEDV